MDSWVWAQLPSPDIASGRLREAVLKHMVHRPCGSKNVNAACMETNKTTKNATSTSLSPFDLQPSLMNTQVVLSTNESRTVTAPLFVKEFVVNG